MQFPTMSGDDLLRRRVTVPSGLSGRLNLLLIAFQRWHQDLIDSWLPVVARLEARHPGLRHYELPVLPSMGWLSRTFINEGMRAGIAIKHAATPAAMLSAGLATAIVLALAAYSAIAAASRQSGPAMA